MNDLSRLSPTAGVELRGRPGTLSSLDHAEIRELLDTSGAIVFRGFSAEVDEFETFTRRFSTNFLVHHGLGRGFISADGTTQTVAPGSAFIPAHIERGYAAPIPSTVFFYCVRPSRAGGATTLYDGCALFEALTPAAQQFFRTHPMRWTVRAPAEIWQRTLGTTDTARASVMLAEQTGVLLDRSIGETVECRFDGDVLLMDFITPSVRGARRGRGEAFANSSLSYLDSWRHDDAIDLRLPDGREFPIEPLEEVLERSMPLAISLEWSPGDFVAIDNFSVLHGRSAFDDPDRLVYIRIGFGSKK